MLKVMENYWKMPDEDRTITPELMYKLKNVPMTFSGVFKIKIN